MAIKKHRKNFKIYLIISLIVVILGSILLISNRSKEYIPETKIEFHQKQAEIYIDEKVELGYTIYNPGENDKLVWSTSNSKVATVDAKGVIKGISFGDVTITVSLNNRSESHIKLRVKSYDVSLKINPSEKRSNGDWYNKNIELEIESLNIKELKYCVTSFDVCEPNKEYKNKISLKTGIWNFYIEALDKNNKVLTHKETFKIDSQAPKCTISRIGKLTDLTTTIAVSCNPDDSGIYKYEWYRDNELVFITDQLEISMTEIYKEGNPKYKVKVYDNALNTSIYKIN